MKTKLMLFIIFLFTGCSQKPSESSSEFFKVSGKLVQGGLPSIGATVSIDNSDVLSTMTDSLGYFEIANVPKGSHTISFKKVNSNGSFISKSSSISVQSDITLNSLILPKGVQMYTPKETVNSISIFWSPTDANDFREYKVFRHTSSGLDETTGELIHVATAINDTSFNDLNIPPGITYFYRVYVMNEFGKLGGSNIVSISTVNSSIVVNGGFEEKDTTGKPIGWSTTNLDTIVDFSLVSNVVSHSGSNAMRGYTTVIIPGPIDGHLEQQFSSLKLIGGAEYQFSFWYNVDTLTSGSLEVNLTNNKTSGSYIFFWSNYGQNPLKGWVNKVITFTAPTLSNPTDYFLRFIIRKNNPPETKYIVWIDDVELKKK